MQGNSRVQIVGYEHRASRIVTCRECAESIERMERMAYRMGRVHLIPNFQGADYITIMRYEEPANQLCRTCRRQLVTL